MITCARLAPIAASSRKSRSPPQSSRSLAIAFPPLGAPSSGFCQRRPDLRAIERKVANPYAERVSDRVRERRGRRALRRLARPEERLAGAIDDLHVDGFGQLLEAEDRIAAPVAARDPLL